MNLRIEEIENKNLWEGFLLRCEEKTFLNSWNWGEFNKMMGNKIWRLGIFKIENLIGVALAVKIKAKRGTFLFVPHGPTIIQNSKLKILETLLEELKKIAKKENCSFIRVAPIWLGNEENAEIFTDLGFRQAPIHMHPELTWELDITSSEEELLRQMRKTTRYLIRQAQKNKDIKIDKTSVLKDIEKFYQLEQATVNRRHFTPFSLEYLKNEFSVFFQDGQIALFLGRYRDEVVAGGIFVFWQGIGFYHHGASSLKYPKVPVSYLMLWEAIKEAKNRGCKKFNFWGIAPVFPVGKTGIFNFQFSIFKQIPNPIVLKTKVFEKLESQIPKKHPWYGLTLFKMGFGGYEKEYVKTQDLPLSPKYWLNYIIEKIRKIKRGL